jgi:hypothetical protein
VAPERLEAADLRSARNRAYSNEGQRGPNLPVAVLRLSRRGLWIGSGNASV